VSSSSKGLNVNYLDIDHFGVDDLRKCAESALEPYATVFLVVLRLFLPQRRSYETLKDCRNFYSPRTAAA
jgi:hypothetical protein